MEYKQAMLIWMRLLRAQDVSFWPFCVAALYGWLAIRTALIIDKSGKLLATMMR